jgi:hypothetical protein
MARANQLQKIKPNNMNYSFYLFVNLRILILPNQTEYDLQHGNDLKLFEIYRESNFNIGEIEEYQCMLNFLQDLKHKINLCI